MRRAIAAISTAVAVIACSGPAPSATPSLGPAATSPNVQEALAHRPCRGADLALDVGRSGAYEGHQTQELLLANHASDPCSLAGVPTMMLYLDSGGQLPVEPGTFAHREADLATGQQAWMLIGTPPTCSGVGHPKVGSKIKLTLPSGDVLSGAGLWVNVECGGPAVVVFAVI